MGAQDAIDAGANAFLRKERSVEELRRVFLEVASLAAVLGSPPASAESRVPLAGVCSGKESVITSEQGLGQSEHEHPLSLGR